MSTVVDWEQITQLCSRTPLPELLDSVAHHLPVEITVDIWLWDYQRRSVTSMGSGRRLAAQDLHELPRMVTAVQNLTLLGENLGLVTLEGRLDPADDSGELIGRLASLLAPAVRASASIGDAEAVSRRASAMSLPAEMQWNLLPPSQLRHRELALTAAVEPAYDTGGDVYDYALNGNRLFVAVLDARGHGLRAATTVAVATAAMRRARRSGEDLTAIAAEMSTSIGSLGLPDEFVTAVLVDLDLNTWTGRWLSAGHLPPLIVGANVTPLEPKPTLPLGMVLRGQTSEPTMQPFELQPEEALTLYSDGIIENASMDHGEPIGIARFQQSLHDRLTSDLPDGHVARRVVEDLLTLSGPVIRDDATLLIAQRTGA